MASVSAHSISCGTTDSLIQQRSSVCSSSSGVSLCPKSPRRLAKVQYRRMRNYLQDAMLVAVRSDSSSVPARAIVCSGGSYGGCTERDSGEAPRTRLISRLSVAESRRGTVVALAAPSFAGDSRPLSGEDEETDTNSAEDIVGGSGEGNGSPIAGIIPSSPPEAAGTLVAEVTLEGDDLKVQEFPGKDDSNAVASLKESVLNFGGDGKEFSLTEVGGLWKTGKKAGEAKMPDFNASMYDVKDGVDPLSQWTSTELTMQHSQIARIATDVFYLQGAFAFFGGVRVVEALFSVFSSNPPDYGKAKEFLNALDPFTISWLAYNLRKPIEGILEVDPLNLEEVVKLKANIWEELHKFYERQWKVVSF